MSLTWKDLVTTLLAVATGWLYYAMSKGISVPLISGYRGAILVVALIGISMCALSGGSTTSSGPYMVVASVLGVAALLLIVYGLIVGTQLAFTLLTGTILILWVISTVRHIIFR